jgi:four helix bundle protein
MVIERFETQDCHELEEFKIAHHLAMKLFYVVQEFPKEEKYALTDQIKRCSREVAGHVAKAWGSRRQEEKILHHTTEALSALEETRSWLMFALNCGYIHKELFKSISLQYDKLASQLKQLHDSVLIVKW